MANDTNKKSTTPGVFEYTLSKPFEYNGKTHEKLTFNFDSLTGNDILSVEDEMVDNAEYYVTEASRSFQLRIAAKAAEIGSDVIKALPAKDFSKIVRAARDFLTGTE